MKFTAIIGLVLLLGAAGCQHPDEVQIKPDETADELAITSLIAADSAQVQLPVDSLGVTPQEGHRFAGLVLLNSVKHDDGRGMKSGAFSWVYFADRSRGLQLGGITFGYYGLNLTPRLINPLLVNGLAMLRVPHRVRVLGTTQFYGYEYIRDLAAEYQPKTTYRWQAAPDSIGSFDISIMSPDTLKVLVPAGGSRIPRDQDLMVRWRGKGNIALIISTYNPMTGRTKPVLKIRPRVNQERMLLSAALLRSLPRDRYFMFSMVLANREERTVIAQFPSEILVQAAAVYNTYVELL